MISDIETISQLERYVDTALLPHSLHVGRATLPDGSRLSTSPSLSRAEARLYLEDCLIGARPWFEHADAAERALADLDRAMSLHTPLSPAYLDCEDSDAILLLQRWLSGDLAAIDISGDEPRSATIASVSGGLLFGGQALRYLARHRYAALCESAQIWSHAAGEIEGLAADPHAAALRSHPVWAALLGRRIGVGAVLAAVSQRLSTDIVRIVRCDTNPRSGDRSLSMAVRPPVTDAWLDATAKWFAGNSAAQEKYSEYLCDLDKELDLSGRRGSLH